MSKLMSIKLTIRNKNRFFFILNR